MHLQRVHGVEHHALRRSKRTYRHHRQSLVRRLPASRASPSRPVSKLAQPPRAHIVFASPTHRRRVAREPRARAVHDSPAIQSSFALSSRPRRRPFSIARERDARSSDARPWPRRRRRWRTVAHTSARRRRRASPVRERGANERERSNGGARENARTATSDAEGRERGRWRRNSEVAAVAPAAAARPGRRAISPSTR